MIGSQYRSALSTRDLRVLITAFIVDNSASWSYVVVVVSYVFGRTHSATWVTGLLTINWTIGMVSGTYAGVLADRYERHRVLVVSALTSMAATLVLAGLVATDAPLVAILVSFGLVRCLSMPVRPASGALIPEVTPESDLVVANSLFAMLESLVVVIGPGIGALLLLTGDATYGVLLNAASYLVAAMLYGSLHVRSRGGVEPGDGLLKTWSAGLVALSHHRTAFVLTMFLFLDSAAVNAANVLMPALADHLGGGHTGYSLLLGSNALGGVLIAVLANKLASSARVTAIIIVSIVVECLPLWLCVYVGSVAPGIPLQVVSGAGMVVVDVLAFTSLQRDLPREVLGRVLGSVEVLLLGGSILASFMGSLLLTHVGIGWALGVIGLGFPALGLLGIPSLLRLDTSAAGEVLALRTRTALLEQLELFAAAPQAVLEQLVRGGQEEMVPAGTVLMQQGDLADALWVLEEGALTVRAAYGAAPELEVGRIEAPGYVGELGLLHRRPRNATVVAATDCRLLRISGEDFEAALEQGRPSPALLGVAGARLARTSLAGAGAARSQRLTAS